MYQHLHEMLNRFYPERETTVTTADPHFVTPAVKTMLRRKNRLMRAGRVEEAAAIAKRVRSIITKNNSVRLHRCDTRRNVRETWSKVRVITRRRNDDAAAGIMPTADVLNRHYASISTDPAYVPVQRKLSAGGAESHCTEYDVFHMLDRLKPTATGMDGLPAWFLRVSAPVIAAPLAVLFNQSISSGVVPRQWKTAVITPVPKNSAPVTPGDYRPISITSVLSRLVERRIVRRYIYPALYTPPPGLCFTDQYAFRPTGSTTAALVAIQHTVCAMLSNNQFVRVFVLDFSKAFDSIRHNLFLRKLSSLSIPDEIYNWIVHFFSERGHCTRIGNDRSDIAEITASIVQGSSLGPASYVVSAADMQPGHAGNAIIKYADDTYLIIPAVNSHTCTEELQRIQSWADDNNLRLNAAKSREIIFQAHSARKRGMQLPSPCLGIEQVSQITALGVVVNDRMTASDHVTELLSSCTKLLYALRVLRAHGMPQQSLMDVFRATVESKLQYAAPAWSGLCTAGDRARLNAFLRRCVKLGYRECTAPPVEDIFAACDEQLFSKISRNSLHILQQFLPERPSLSYSLRPRPHNKTLITKTSQLNDRDFIIRSIYKDSY